MHDRDAAHAALNELNATLYDSMDDADEVRGALSRAFANDATIHLCHPFGTVEGGEGFYGTALAPLVGAMPDVDRRRVIEVAGTVGDQMWVGHCGHYVGTFDAPFLDIPPTGRIAQMRYHEFFRIENERVVEMQAIWDVPALMMQANAWPMTPSLGVEWMAPAPATGDGMQPGGDPEDDAEAVQLVLDMLAGLQRHKEEGPEAMGLERFWHPKFNWYGPAGIGSMRGIKGFRRDHQIPFLQTLPDRRGAGETPVFFAEGSYVGTTGWPNMEMSVTGGGWLGIAPTGAEITMRSLDFWRIENGLLRENWVLVDLLYVWDQLGVDVFERMHALTFNRRP